VSPAASGKEGELFLLDGMSLAFRAYFALPPDLATSAGVVTNAVHGFANMLLSIVRDHQPGALAVAFDLPGGTFRDAMVEDYKGGRAETPPDLLPQFDMIRDLVRCLGIPLVSLPSYEADDVLATLASRSRDEHRPVVVVTGDRDCFQLVEDPYVRVLYNKRGVSDYHLYDEAGIVERTGLEPQRYPMLAAMRGDSSDNLPGVPGVGEKTAAKLLTTYGDLDGIFSHLEELTPKLRENLTTHEELARNNFAVMTLVRDVPIDIDPLDLEMGGWHRADVEDFFDRLEMKGAWRRVAEMLDAGQLGPGDDGPSGIEFTSALPERLDTQELSVSLATPAKARTILKGCADGPHVALLSESAEQIALLLPGSTEVVVLAAADEHALGALVDGGPVRSDDAKRVLRAALKAGAEPKVPDGDVSIAGYLLDASLGNYDLASMARLHLPALDTSDLGSSGQLSLDARPGDEVLALSAVVVDQLLDVLDPKLEDFGLTSLYRDVELPLVRVLARMEDRGIAVDVAELRSISEDLTSRVGELEQRVQDLAGHPFKVNSPKQLQEVLFGELGLTPGKKTKTGFSTDASVLEGLRGAHPIVDAILEYREIEKLRSTYGEALLAEVGPDQRIHATFRQTVARTGRLSSEQPNLHNIPVRSEEGRRFRRAFVASPGWSLLAADYDQVELRVIAHLSGDDGLLSAFSSGEDIHRSIAANVYGVDPVEITHEQRERAKMVSYGLAYGMEAFGLAQRLGGDLNEAREIMARYFAAFPGLRAYMDRAVEEARSTLQTRTELGRIRPLRDLAASNGAVRAAAERQAMNAGIQGLAADIFKVALVRLDGRLEREGLEARIVLQVHDEVLVEAPPAEREAVEVATIEELMGAASLAVPLKVSMAWGESWADAKG
jgi:DNA polymerase-1